MNGFSGSMLIGVMCQEPMMMIKKMMMLIAVMCQEPLMMMKIGMIMIGVMCYEPNTGESGEAFSGIFTT